MQGAIVRDKMEMQVENNYQNFPRSSFLRKYKSILRE
jgi:hypothetical protein